MRALRVLTAALVLAAVTACSVVPAERAAGGDAAAAPARPSAPPAPTSSPHSSPDRPSAQDVVHDPDAILAAVSVRGRSDAWEVRGLWVVNRRWTRMQAYAASTDGFATATYRRGTHSRLHRLVEPGPPGPRPLPRGWPADAPAMANLLTYRVPSLAPRTQAVVGGGDGATLFPFQAVARTVDGGSTWSTHELPLFDGERAYSSAQVVTSDGRLLALLSAFSDDRLRRPADRHHGLWASGGGDWTAYRPHRPRFFPPLTPAPSHPGAGLMSSPLVSLAVGRGPVPFLWVQTWDSRVYVSTDDARTFREIPVR